MKYSHLFSQASALAPVSEAEWIEFESQFVHTTFEKGKVILSPGQNSFNFHVVIKGILRNYDVDIDGKEFTKIFRGPGGLIGPYAEMISQTPVKYFIQAVTEAEVLIFSYKDFEKMMEKYKSWETLGRKFAERNYMEKEKKEYELMHFNSDERYDLFLKEYGPLADLIPQYQVASFLGISPEAMNRMIKKRKEI